MGKIYPQLNVMAYETYFDQEGRALFREISDVYGTEIQGVPTLFIDEKVIVGFSNSIARSVEQEIQRCIKEGCESPIDRLMSKKIKDKDTLNAEEEILTIIGDRSSGPEERKKSEMFKKVTIPAVLFAAFVDAINPCAFAVLIILLTTVLTAGIRKRALFAGLAFSLSVYISYFLMGVGLFSAIQAAGVTHIFYIMVAVLAIGIGLFNLKDYFWYGKWFVMEVPMSWRPMLKKMIKGVTSVPGAFLIGFVVSLFLLPCTSGPYLIILGLLAHSATKGYALFLLLLYNFIFILPMLIITLAIYFGFTTTEEAEKWRTGKLKTLHLIAGIIILLLGIGMFTAMALGML